MCGIVGLFLKNPELEPELGRHVTAMLIEMSERGPDSAGVAIYRNPVPEGQVKLSLCHGDPEFDWSGLARAAAAALGEVSEPRLIDNHCVLTVAAGEAATRTWLAEKAAGVHLVSVGSAIEIFKEMGPPREVAQRFGITRIGGSHALGHTRMATESAVTTEHSHPFSAGMDLCLVHNGSLSNHNRLRRWLRRHGMTFQTDNDSEVAAAYYSYRLSQGANLEQALTAGLSDLDGFFTFAIGTRNGFAVVRDEIACKPAVLAETDDWVAMASEFRAIAPLPGVEEAIIWEPKPATVYTWGRA